MAYHVVIPQNELAFNDFFPMASLISWISNSVTPGPEEKYKSKIEDDWILFELDEKSDEQTEDDLASSIATIDQVHVNTAQTSTVVPSTTLQVLHANIARLSLQVIERQSSQRSMETLAKLRDRELKERKQRKLRRRPRS